MASANVEIFEFGRGSEIICMRLNAASRRTASPWMNCPAPEGNGPNDQTHENPAMARPRRIGADRCRAAPVAHVVDEELSGSGARQQRLRHGEAKCLCGLQVYDQLDLGWRHDRQIGWLGAIQDLPGVPPGLLHDPAEARRVTEQP